MLIKLGNVLCDIKRYDKQFKDYISEFNRKHSGQVSLLDFSNYATSFGDLSLEKWIIVK